MNTKARIPRQDRIAKARNRHGSGRFLRYHPSTALSFPVPMMLVRKLSRLVPKEAVHLSQEPVEVCFPVPNLRPTTTALEQRESCG
jgi:hypothetical protein